MVSGRVPSAAILTARGLKKAFGTRTILDDATLTVHEGDRIGLVGVNGCGKSTFLKLLLGDANDAPDAGEVSRRRGLTIEYVPQEPYLPADATVDVVLGEGLAARAAKLGQPEDDLRYEVRGLAAALATPPGDAKIGTLSLGERRRVALARALLVDPDLLALDEPTNHLDARTVAWLEERLAVGGGTLLLVTHDRYFLDRVATRIVELDRGALHAYEGNYQRYLELQAERLSLEDRAESARLSFVRRELDWVRRSPGARRTKQKARLDRFNDIVDSAPGQDDKRADPLRLRLPTGPRLGKSVLDLKHVTKTIGDRVLFRDLTLAMKAGDRIGIVGPNGAGKSTLLKVILGQLQPDSGEVIVGLNTKFAYLDQARARLRDDETVLHAVAGEHDSVFLEDGPVHVRTFLRMMLFPDAAADTPVGVLSGGERNRVELARLLRMGGNVIVLDEPTNDLDLVTLGVLEDALAAFPGCALIVSHDRWFLDRVATSILAFEDDGRVSFHEGDHTTYLKRRKAETASSAPPSASASPSAPVRPPSASAAASAPASRPKKRTFKENQELSTIEAAISAAEARVSALEATVNDPDIYRTRSAEVPALVADLTAARAEVDRLYARWQELDAIPAS